MNDLQCQPARMARPQTATNRPFNQYVYQKIKFSTINSQSPVTKFDHQRLAPMVIYGCDMLYAKTPNKIQCYRFVVQKFTAHAHNGVTAQLVLSIRVLWSQSSRIEVPVVFLLVAWQEVWPPLSLLSSSFSLYSLDRS